ncbi:hypothetical protein VITFI_CDS0591 [Vitreoscilla filiformis]|uniref:Uncharacterized protein n=1 Tax=Vitreoscilla filiformis TaxID=63 RepID=A0A221KBZ6_VITFI|nr:hypothetical protein VITFI_CDS0588 [Vitreoscilla filiformis]ASM76370.1 hypothetical protein VITFI_CDS0591 [Vitreoscilla filiformis]
MLCSSFATTLIRLFELLKNIHKGLALQAKKLVNLNPEHFGLRPTHLKQRTVASARTIDSTL